MGDRRIIHLLLIVVLLMMTFRLSMMYRFKSLQMNENEREMEPIQGGMQQDRVRAPFFRTL